MKTGYLLQRALGWYYSATGILRPRATTDRVIIGSADQGQSSLLSVDSGSESIVATAQRGITFLSSHLLFVETATDLTCTFLTTSGGTPNRAAVYIKGNKFVIAHQCAANGQIRYATLQLDGAGVTWQQSGTAP